MLIFFLQQRNFSPATGAVLLLFSHYVPITIQTNTAKDCVYKQANDVAKAIRTTVSLFIIFNHSSYTMKDLMQYQQILLTKIMHIALDYSDKSNKPKKQ